MSANDPITGEWDKFRVQKPPVRPAAPASEPEKKSARGLNRDEFDLIIVAIVLAVLLLVAAGVFFIWTLDYKEEGVMTQLLNRVEGSADQLVVKKPVYYELPEVLVNLASTTRRTKFLKMSVTLELHDQEDTTVIEANSPRIMDAFNTYLRGLEPQELSGSAGIVRLREELMVSVNRIIGEGVVKNILFNEITVQ
jgi:flagellar FliL protein